MFFEDGTTEASELSWGQAEAGHHWKAHSSSVSTSLLFLHSYRFLLRPEGEQILTAEDMPHWHVDDFKPVIF